MTPTDVFGTVTVVAAAISSPDEPLPGASSGLWPPPPVARGTIGEVAVDDRLAHGRQHADPTDPSVRARPIQTTAMELPHHDRIDVERPPMRADQPFPDDEWVPRLKSTGAERDHAIACLRGLLVRAARHQMGRMPQAVDLGATRRDEIVDSAADDATLSVLRRLDSFEGRSRFSTWAFKFGILQAGVEVRRAAWNGRDVPLDDHAAGVLGTTGSPESHSEAVDLAAAVRTAIETVLTPHQRRVAVSLLVDEVPIDVLADRLGTNRNALYKTLHDARRRIRSALQDQGLLEPTPEVTS